MKVDKFIVGKPKTNNFDFFYQNLIQISVIMVMASWPYWHRKKI